MKVNYKDLKKEEILELLSLTDEAKIQELFEKAYAVKEKYVGKKVYFRGLIEFSNYCIKNCYYCGLRKDHSILRYEMSEQEILDAALFAYRQGYGSIVLQSGERTDEIFIKKIVSCLQKITKQTNKELSITLCVGEQEEKTYQDFFEAGATRYLLRIETSNPILYQKLHPADHSYHNRLHCLKTLKKIGYQTGTGVMIGLPFQTLEDLANDLLFFREMGVHMVGMGPYLEHPETPLTQTQHKLLSKEERLLLSLKMIAILRILMPTLNIASTTALQSIDPLGREKGLLAGANIIMPNITPTTYRKDYVLYENKPCLEESSEQCKNCLSHRITNIGETIGWFEKGDPKSYSLEKEKEK